MSAVGVLTPARESVARHWTTNRWEIAAHLALVVAYVSLFVAQWNQPYTIDEAAFPYAAGGILDHGVPEFYNGDTRPTDMGLWHPPAYVYALAGHMAIFGESPAAVRSFGLLCVLLAAIVGQGALRVGYPAASKWSRLSLTAILLLNPLVISGSLIPDIDGTLGILVVMLGVLTVAYIMRPSTLVGRVFLATGSLWFVASWTKFTLAILLVPVIGFAALLRPGGRRIQTVIASAGGAVVGSIAALLTWLALSWVLSADFKGPFDYFVNATARKAGGDPLWVTALTTLSSDPAVFWMGPLLLVTLLVGLAVLWPQLRAAQTGRLSLVLLGTTALIIVGYASFSTSVFHFPKYWGAAIPVASVLMALLVGVAADAPAWRRYSLGLSRGLLIALTGILATYATWWAFNAINGTVVDGGRSARLLLASGLLLTAAFVLVLATVAWPEARGLAAVSCVLVASLTSAIVVQQSLVSISIARADFSTRYYYGERGLSQTVAAVEEQTSVDDVIFAAKDVGLQSHRRFDEDAGPLYSKTPQEFGTYLEARGLALVVTRNNYDYSEAVFPDHFRVLREHFRPADEQPSPDFTLWVPR